MDALNAQTERTIAAVERAVALMAQRLDDADVPTLEELASAAHLSKYHFHRVYRLVTGETCSQTMRRLRLQQAGAALAAGASVAETAQLAGYQSAQALAKALRKSVDATATELAAQPDRLTDGLRSLGRVDTGDGVLRVELASPKPLRVVAIRTQGQYDTLAETYIQLAVALGGMNHIAQILGISMNNAEAGFGGDVVFYCAFQTQPQTDLTAAKAVGAVEQVIDGGLCAVIRHTGGYDALGKTVDAAYWRVLADPEFALRDAPIFMHYVDDPANTPTDVLRTDVYLPLEPRGDSL